MYKRLAVIFLCTIIFSAIGVRVLKPRFTRAEVEPGQTAPQDTTTIKPIELPEPITPVVPTSYIDENNRRMVINVDSMLVLVNKERNLPADYVPEDLVRVQVAFPFTEDQPRMYMRKEAARALEELFAAAYAEGLRLYATSGYRSYETQKSIFFNRASVVGEEVANMTSAYPGQSEHQTGLAMDITSPTVNYRLVEHFGETPEGMWLRENSHHHGYIIRYLKDKEHITGYSYEPWHLRYVGKEVAKDIYLQDLTLEEYLWQRPEYQLEASKTH